MKRADVQLPDIFDDDIRAEFQKEFRAKNPKLMQVLARRENLSKMLDMLATENPPNMLTYEVLTAEHAVIQGLFFFSFSTKKDTKHTQTHTNNPHKQILLLHNRHCGQSYLVSFEIQCHQTSQQLCMFARLLSTLQTVAMSFYRLSRNDLML